MSITKTTLSGDVSASAQTIQVASATGATIKNVVQIDSEFLTQTADASGTTLAVRRGEQGGYPSTHVSGAVVLMGLASDFPPAPPGSSTPIPVAPNWTATTYVAAGAISIPTTKQNVFVRLLGASTNAYTLADPTYAQEGQEMTIQAEAAHAYTVSNAAGSGFNGGGAGTDVATFGGAIGDNFSIKAVSGVWNVLNTINVSFG